MTTVSTTRWRPTNQRPSPKKDEPKRIEVNRAPPGSVRQMSETTSATTSATVSGTTSAIAELSNAYVAEYARRRPIIATYIGLPVEQDRLDDLTPAGLADRYEFAAS